MTDTAELCRRANAEGFEQGSLAAVNLILAWMQRNGHNELATALHADWEGGRMLPPEFALAPATPLPVVEKIDAAHFEPGPSKMTRDEARGKGFTGNVCDQCGSMEMQIAGHCEVCSSCGTTTGCS